MHSPAEGAPLRRQPANRASQFMPFAALRGYYELIRERDRIPEPLHELSDEEAADLSGLMARVRRGSTVRVRHHDGTAYVMSAGTVTDLDPVGRTISVAGTTIPFGRIAAMILDEDVNP